MKCKICGAKLANDKADICLNCYKDYQEEEDLKKDVNEKLVVKRKYKISYVLSKYMEIIFILILSICGCITCKNYLAAVLCTVISVLVMVVILAINKIIAKNTKAVFYERKVIYTSKNFLYHTEKTVKYSDIKDISVFQTHRQKRKGFGDICVYAKSNIPGVSFLNGFQIKDVGNVAEALQEISNILGIE